MLIEDQRLIHEDLERLEQAVSDRLVNEPRNIRDQTRRDHQIADLLSYLQSQSVRLQAIYQDVEGIRQNEHNQVATGDPYENFYQHFHEISDFHRRNPTELTENLERAYKPQYNGDGEALGPDVDDLFSGEEAFGRYLDLNSFHEDFLNLPGIKGGRRLTYLQYLDVFDDFTPPQFPMKRHDKLRNEYFRYLDQLCTYLKRFIKKTKPLEDTDSLFKEIDTGFKEHWESGSLPGWASQARNEVGSSDKALLWCDACKKEFQNVNVYQNHLNGKKHKKAASVQTGDAVATANGTNTNERLRQTGIGNLQERVVAGREWTIAKLAAALREIRSDTKLNVERRQGMTQREREQEQAALEAESARGQVRQEDASDEEGDERMSNPLKLPLAWDGKPIPFWLYKLHGLGVEFTCEICGNFIYMGRRAFDKHFNEPRHVHGLRCLGINNTTLFREITRIEEAQKLWDKIAEDKARTEASTENDVEMEDPRGNVMPEKVYNDLQRQGIL